MIRTDVKYSRMEDAIIEIQQDLIKMKTDQKIFYQHLENKLQNAISVIHQDLNGKHFHVSAEIRKEDSREKSE